MSVPDPEGITMLAKVIGAFAAVGVPIVWFFKLLDRKLDKHTYRTDQQTLASTLAVYRKDISDIYDALRQQDDTAEKRHRELLMHLLERKP